MKDLYAIEVGQMFWYVDGNNHLELYEKTGECSRTGCCEVRLLGYTWQGSPNWHTAGRFTSFNAYANVIPC